MSTTPRTLSERDETYVGDIVRDENWLVNSSCTLSSPTPNITLHSANKEVLRITHDGRLVTGEGLSKEAATQEAAKLLIASFEEQIQKMVERELAAAKAECNRLYESSPTALDALTAELARLRAELAVAQNWVEHHSKHADDLIGENVKLRADLERFTGHGLLDCHAICDQRDAAIARAERAEAELADHKTALKIANRSADEQMRYKREAEAERDALAKDKARLDWLSVSDAWFDYPATGAFTPDTIRAAIDAAMKEGSK